MTPGPRGWIVLLCLVTAAFCFGMEYGAKVERLAWYRWTYAHVVFETRGGCKVICAGHYPRQHFTIDELAAMPVYELGCGGFAPEGWNRSTDDRGHPIAFYQPALDDPKPHCVVRPVVRVKASQSRVAQCS